MLILTRRPTESIFVGKDIQVKILSVNGVQVRVGIHAPKEFPIYREEIFYPMENSHIEINQEDN